MSDTAKRGVPVRFCFLTGGTKPQDVVSLAEFLDSTIEPLLTTEEELARSGRQIADDYDWEAALAEVRAEEDSPTPNLPAESDLPAQPAETANDATDTEIPVGGVFEGEPEDLPPSKLVREI